MAGGRPRRGINWSLFLQALSTGSMLLVVIVGGLMGWSYMNGANATKVADLERRIVALESRPH